MYSKIFNKKYSILDKSKLAYYLKRNPLLTPFNNKHSILLFNKKNLSNDKKLLNIAVKASNTSNLTLFKFSFFAKKQINLTNKFYSLKTSLNGLNSPLIAKTQIFSSKIKSNSLKIKFNKQKVFSRYFEEFGEDYGNFDDDLTIEQEYKDLEQWTWTDDVTQPEELVAQPYGELSIDSDFVPESPTKKTLFIEYAIDTEYCEKFYLSLQVTCRTKINDENIMFSFMVFDKRYKNLINLDLIQEIQQEKILECETYFFFEENLDELEENLLFKYSFKILSEKGRFNQMEKNVKVKGNVYFYFSAKDITLAFGLPLTWPLYSGKTKTASIKRNTKFKHNSSIIQRRSIMGQICFKESFKIQDGTYKDFNIDLTLRDLFGWSTRGLDSLIETSGLSTDTKKILDDYKECMDVALQKFPKEFIKYSMNDSTILFQIVKIKIDSSNKLLKDIYGIKSPDYEYTIHNMPFSLGRLVFSTWSKYLDYVVLKNSKLYKLAFCKMGIINKLHKDHNKNLEYINYINENIHSLSDFEKFKNDKPNEYKEMETQLLKPGVFKYTAQQYCSIKYLLDYSTSDNRYLLGMTYGGRTTNDQPLKCLIEYGGDIDLESAYANQLQDSVFPIGRPHIYALSDNQTETMTLKQFFDKFEHQLSRYKLVKIVVSGILEFLQDLIFSKIPSTKSIEKKITNFSELETGKQAIQTQFLLLRKEIKNEFITFDTWQVIKKVATAQELKGFNNLKVNAAIYYLDSDVTENIEDYLNDILKDKQKFEFDKKTSQVLDKRTYKSFVIPLKNYFGPIVKRKAELKKQKDSPEAQAESNSLKDQNNCGWGVTTSIFFETNNVIVSENVTSGVRTNIWLLSKPMNLHFCGTDGGAYSLLKVAFLNEKFKKPGFNSFSNVNKLIEHPAIYTGPLAGIDWKSLFDQNIKPHKKKDFEEEILVPNEFWNLDKYAFQHIQNFWKSYRINFDKKIDHKLERSFRKLSYLNKANYMVMAWNKDTKIYDDKFIVARGFTKTKRYNPLFDILDFIIEEYKEDDDKNIYKIPNLTEKFNYEVNFLIKILSFKKSLIKNEHNQFVSA